MATMGLQELVRGLYLRKYNIIPIVYNCLQFPIFTKCMNIIPYLSALLSSIQSSLPPTWKHWNNQLFIGWQCPCRLYLASNCKMIFPYITYSINQIVKCAASWKFHANTMVYEILHSWHDVIFIIIFYLSAFAVLTSVQLRPTCSVYNKTEHNLK